MVFVVFSMKVTIHFTNRTSGAEKAPTSVSHILRLGAEEDELYNQSYQYDNS